MNDYDEDKWSAEQRALDGRIATDVEALTGSRWAHEQAEIPLGEWLIDAQDTAKTIRAQVARLTNAKRRAHWEAELSALGLAKPVEPAAEKPKATAAPGGKAKDG